jgi:hypothetical protein
MLLEGSNRRIHAVDRHAGMVSLLTVDVLMQTDNQFFNGYVMFLRFCTLRLLKAEFMHLFCVCIRRQ